MRGAPGAQMRLGALPPGPRKLGGRAGSDGAASRLARASGHPASEMLFRPPGNSGMRRLDSWSAPIQSDGEHLLEWHTAGSISGRGPACLAKALAIRHTSLPARCRAEKKRPARTCWASSQASTAQSFWSLILVTN